MLLFDPNDSAAVELLWALHEAPFVTGLLATVFDRQTLRFIVRSSQYVYFCTKKIK
jgi:hypothetical protein